MMNVNRNKEKGFTLIELMIVVVIIGILATLAIPRFSSSAVKTKQSEAKENLKQIYIMQRAYYMEHEVYALNGVVADSANTLAFRYIFIEIMVPARYAYTMTTSGTGFTCTATANLDDDPAIDTWQIDDAGFLQAIIDDVQQ